MTLVTAVCAASKAPNPSLCWHGTWPVNKVQMYAFDSGGIDADTAGMALPRAGDFDKPRKFFQFVIDKVSEK